jgi:hypothetical protein
MRELKEYKYAVSGEAESAPVGSPEELFSIPDETSCSAEFPQGCIFSE